MIEDNFDCDLMRILCSKELNIYIDAIQVNHDLKKAKIDRGGLIQFIARSARINYHNQIYNDLREKFEEEILLPLLDELLLIEIKNRK